MFFVTLTCLERFLNRCLVSAFKKGDVLHLFLLHVLHTFEGQSLSLPRVPLKLSVHITIIWVCAVTKILKVESESFLMSILSGQSPLFFVCLFSTGHVSLIWNSQVAFSGHQFNLMLEQVTMCFMAEMQWPRYTSFPCTLAPLSCPVYYSCLMPPYLGSVLQSTTK